jgi:formamidase
VSSSHRIAFDVRTPLVAAPELGHNRWHPDIAPIARIAPGETIVLDLRDGLDGQITPETRAEDLLGLDMNRGHPLTGPLYVEGAEPGDLLEVETLAVEPDRFGSTIIIPGFGLLSDRFSEPYVVKWTIQHNVARSDDLPGVAIRGAPFLGVVGVAPSHERLRRFLEREADLSRRGGTVLPPDPKSAVPSRGPAATEGLRTVPPRETGGNMDIKQLTVGSRLTLPVDVRGALLSVGDAHFAQGDGESCGVAIEMHARVHLRVGLQKGNELRWRPDNPTFEFTEPPGPPAGRRYVVTTGLPVDSQGRNEYLDLNLAARAALEEMIAYITEVRGYSPNQAYVLVSVAADLRVSEVVDVPNAIVSAVLPLDIFEDKVRA